MDRIIVCSACVTCDGPEGQLDPFHKSKTMHEPDAKTTEVIGRLKPEWEYLFVPSRRQLGRDKASHG